MMNRVELKVNCKLRRNGMTVPRERNGYSVFIGTKVPL